MTLSRYIEITVYRGGCWFRIWGYGLSIVNKRKHPPLFSERYGYRKVLRFGRWGVEILRPWVLKEKKLDDKKHREAGI